MEMYCDHPLQDIFIRPFMHWLQKKKETDSTKSGYVIISKISPLSIEVARITDMVTPSYQRLVLVSIVEHQQVILQNKDFR